MNRLAQDALLAGLARRLEEHGSWSGETHLQKATYVLRELFNVDFDFDFILYKHGPFSFELRDELGSMQADGLVEPQPQGPRYGPRLLTTHRGRELEARLRGTMDRYGPALDWVADRVGDRGVLELERLATGLWVTREQPRAAVEQRAERMITLKPHVSRASAEAAIEEIDQLLADASATALTTTESHP